MKRKKKSSLLPPTFLIIVCAISLCIIVYSGIVLLGVIPPFGCRFQEVQCIQAPCPPVLVCKPDHELEFILDSKIGERKEILPLSEAPSVKER